MSSLVQSVIRTGAAALATIEAVGGRIARSRVGDAFSLDLRSLAFFRICLGLLIIVDIAARIPNFRAHYTDAGILPRDLLVSTMSDNRWSLFLLNSSDLFQKSLFAVGILAAVCMILGYRTRLMVVVAWVILVSLQARNPIVLSGADSLLRVVTFWAMLLPLGAVWSVDRLRAQVPQRPVRMTFVSWATAGLLLQIAVMYWATVIFKDGSTWREDGTALYYATGAYQITRPVGEWLHGYPDLLKIGTHIGFGIELLAPFFLFIPYRKGLLRLVGIGAIISLHIGIMLIMDVALFPWISSLVMLAFLPDPFWVAMASFGRRVQVRFPQLNPAPYLRRALAWTPALVPAAQGHAAGAWDDAGQAVARTSLRSSRFLPAAWRGGGRPATPEEPRATLRSTWYLNLFAAFCLMLVMAWNLASVSAYNVPQSAAPVAYGLGLYQKWNMFAPNPPNATVWYAVRGYVEGGEAVDLLTPVVYDDFEHARAFTFERPDNIVSGYYKDKYWRKYFSAIAQENYTEHRKEFARYVCRNWNAYYGGEARLETVQLIFIKQPTRLDGTTGTEERKLLAEYTCA